MVVVAALAPGDVQPLWATLGAPPLLKTRVNLVAEGQVRLAAGGVCSAAPSTMVQARELQEAVQVRVAHVLDQGSTAEVFLLGSH